MEGDFRVGDWVVRPTLGTISRGDKSVHLEPKVMEVLLYFARHPKEVLTKERVIQAVWPDTFVTDDVLIHAVSELRKAFGDGARDGGVIHTVPKRGYRMVALCSADVRETEPTLSRRSWLTLVMTSVGLLVTVVTGAYLYLPGSTSVPEGSINSIAILPFYTTNRDFESQSLAEGIPVTIRHRLSEVQSLQVVPGAALLRFGPAPDVQTVAEELGVQAVFTGTLQLHNETLTVNVELVDGHNRLLWGKRYTRPIENLLPIQEEITNKILQTLSLTLTATEEGRLRRRYTTSAEAFQEFLRGRETYGRYFAKVLSARTTGEDVEAVQEEALQIAREAIDSFYRAIKKDRQFVMAWIHLSRLHWNLGWYSNSIIDYERAVFPAYQAVRIDDHCALAHHWNGWLAFSRRDWETAEREYRRAQHLDSRYRPPGYYSVWMGRPEEAVANLEEPFQGDWISNPQNISPNWVLYFAREYDQLTELARQKLIYYPEHWDFHFLLGQCYEQKGMYEEAIIEYVKAGESRNDESYLQSCLRVFREFGMESFWRAHIEGRHHSIRKPYDRAAYHAVSGDKDAAFIWLEKTYALPVAVPLVGDRRFDSLRDDPRFEELLRKLNLPEDVIQKHLSLR